MPSDRKPPSPKAMTIGDVARMAKVGVGTVSRVLNSSRHVSAQTAKRVRRVLKRTGYRPASAARALRRGKTDTLGLLYNTGATRLSEDRIFLSVLDSAQIEARRANYELVVTTMKTDFQPVPPSFVRTLNNLVADALVLVSYTMTEAGLEALRGRPVVLVDALGKGIVTSVANNHYHSIREAVGRLAEQGHRRIALVHQKRGGESGREIYRGYCEEMKRRGLERREEWEISPEEDRLHVERLLDHPQRPTAVIVSGTKRLLETSSLLQAKGLKVPQDLSLMVIAATWEAETPHEMIRPASGYYIQWAVPVRTAIEEALAIVRGDKQIRHRETPLEYRDFGTVGPPAAD